MSESERPLTPPGHMLLTNDEYARLLEAAWSDDMLIQCEICGAWIDRDDPAAANIADFTGCWKAATADPKNDHLCRSHRAPEPTANSNGM
jgi:hypothetical protein